MGNTITLPESRWRKVEEMLKAAVTPEIVNEEEAIKLLGWTKPYFSNKKKTIPMDWYTVNALGKRFYFKRKILGLRKQ